MINCIGRGFPIVVSSTAKETKALYSLRDPMEVNSFLLLLGKWKGSSSVDKSAGSSIEGKKRVMAGIDI